VRFSAAQTGALERRFSASKYLSPDERRTLAATLRLSDRQVRIILFFRSLYSLQHVRQNKTFKLLLLIFTLNHFTKTTNLNGNILQFLTKTNVKPLVSAAFPVVSSHQSALGPRGGLWLVPTSYV
jgi:hypothetical protein